MESRSQPPQRSLRALEWLNFFLADVQTGLGPFLAAYLTAGGWNPARIGYVLTVGGLTTVALQTPAGAIVDVVRRKRALMAGGGRSYPRYRALQSRRRSRLWNNRNQPAVD